MSTPRPYTVSELTAMVGGALAARPELEDLLVEGEVADLSTPASGHLYFSLKDREAVLRCVVWRSTRQRLGFALTAGMRVICRGGVTTYARAGQYQLTVSAVEPTGIGALAVAVEQRKRRLEAEGLFDQAAKRSLPLLPRRVVVVTSRSGAALRDVLSVAARRAPCVDLVLSPATVQGDGAAETIVLALRRAAQVGGAEVVLLVRGGGSLEDLMAFNDAAVARAIRSCPLPVVTGIGHQVDLTIADLAADRRAATPSNAAELSVPDCARLAAELARRGDQLQVAVGGSVRRVREGLAARAASLGRLSPAQRLARHRDDLTGRRARLDAAIRRTVDERRQRRDAGAARLLALSPLKVLERGYSITTEEGGRVLRTAAALREGDLLRTRLAAGTVISRVVGVDAGPERTYDGGKDHAGAGESR